MSNEMDDWQSLEAFREGLKKATSGCYDMSRVKKSKQWAFLGKQLHILRQIGEKLYSSHALSKAEVLAQADSASATIERENRKKGFIID